MVDGFAALGNLLVLFPQHRQRNRVKSRKALLLRNQPAQIAEQVLVGLPDAGAAASGVFHHVLELLGEVGNSGGFLLKLQ